MSSIAQIGPTLIIEGRMPKKVLCVNVYSIKNRKLTHKINELKMSGTRLDTSHHRGRFFLETGTKRERKGRFHYLWLRVRLLMLFFD